MISILVISRYAAPPYPAAPDFPRKRQCYLVKEQTEEDQQN